MNPVFECPVLSSLHNNESNSKSRTLWTHQSILIAVDIVGAKGMRPVTLSVAQGDLLEVGTEVWHSVQELHRGDVVLPQRLGSVQHLKKIEDLNNGMF